MDPPFGGEKVESGCKETALFRHDDDKRGENNTAFPAKKGTKWRAKNGRNKRGGTNVDQSAHFLKRSTVRRHLFPPKNKIEGECSSPVQK